MSKQRYIQRISSLLSTILHPLVFVVVSSTLVSVYIERNVWKGLRDSSIFFMSLGPALGHFFTMKRRRAEIQYYKLFLPLVLGGIAVTCLMYRLIQVPFAQLQVLGVTFLVTLGATCINRFWNMSFHASLSMSCAAMLTPFSIIFVTLLSLLSVVVGLARLPIKQHTLAQVIGGWMYGFGITTCLLWIVGSFPL